MSELTSPLRELLAESRGYKEIEDIEKLLETKESLANIPLQPLYMAIQNTSEDHIAELLPLLSTEQRQALLDLDLWHRDTLDVEHFMRWPEIYAKCKEESVIREFVKTESFLLFVKGVVNIYTFDEEEPEYPDHDHFFLTEDHLLLVEYSEEFPFADELQYLIKHLYAEMGVENAYSHLFKVVSDSYSSMQEEEYNNQKERLRDYGFVDYYEALELKASLLGEKEIARYVSKKRKARTPELDAAIKNQALHSRALISYQKGLDAIQQELAAITDPLRRDFLHFNFVRLVNASLTLENAYKEGSVKINRTGEMAKAFMELGHSYVKSKGLVEVEENSFSVLDFSDFYRIGYSLIDLLRRKIKKAMLLTPFDQDEHEYFLGGAFVEFLDGIFSEKPQLSWPEKKSVDLKSYEDYLLAQKRTETLSLALPYISKFYASLEDLKEKGLLQDQFYLNYEVKDIDFEAIILSSFANFSLGFLEKDAQKMGLTTEELKAFVKELKLESENAFKMSNEALSKAAIEFSEKFGLKEVTDFPEYLTELLSIHLSGYEFDELGVEDFKHLGGPILLNIAR